jgi:HTH-type transcriptional regulator/antitoxin HigA
MAMEIKPIRSEADYKAALSDIEQYFDREPKLGTPEADRFDVLAALIGAWEDEHHVIDAPDTVTAIAEVMALRGHKQADLGKLLGSRSRASEIMNRKRQPTIEQAKKLHEEWGVPAASLLATEKAAPLTLETAQRVVSINQERRRPAEPGSYRRQRRQHGLALKQQIDELRQEAYDTGYAAAMRAVVEFSTSGPENPKATAAMTGAPRRQRREQAKPAPRQIRRGDNARHIAEAMMTLPNHTGPAAAIKKALAEKGHDIPYTSIRHGLGQLATRNEVTVSEDGKTWRYVRLQGSA